VETFHHKVVFAWKCAPVYIKNVRTERRKVEQKKIKSYISFKYVKDL